MLDDYQLTGSLVTAGHNVSYEVYYVSYMILRRRKNVETFFSKSFWSINPIQRTLFPKKNENFLYYFCMGFLELYYQIGSCVFFYSFFFIIKLHGSCVIWPNNVGGPQSTETTHNLQGCPINMGLKYSTDVRFP